MITAQEWLQVLYFFVPAYLANMAPVLVQGWFTALARPIDGRRTFGGRRILGDHKTWRGILAGIVVGVLVYEAQRLADAAGQLRWLALLDYGAHPVVPGILLGIGTGIGDAIKSFFKRRVDIAPGASWPVFDQLDFLVGAYLFVMPVCVPPLWPTLAAAPIVLTGSVATTAVGYWLGLKEAWI